MNDYDVDGVSDTNFTNGIKSFVVPWRFAGLHRYAKHCGQA